jgi:hypothetical protein
MSTRSDISKTPPRLAYSCKCGWLDLGHMDSKSYRAHEGAQSLWDQITKESGRRSVRDPGGFQVSYQQTNAKKFVITIRGGVYRSYWVKTGLPLHEKKSVALAIFMEVSMGFETMQSNWFYRNIAGTDSGFSAEDLVSNLIGFYKATDPSLDIHKICQVVSPDASLKVWDTYGAVGQHKNRTFKPLFFPCAECDACAAGKPGGSKAGNHAFMLCSVSIADDGKIVVKPGDYLAKYSAAIYKGDMTKVHEYGRLKGGRMEPITDASPITMGEAIYHIPTWTCKQPKPAHQGPVPWTGALPNEFSTIGIITKGALFRDWGLDDSLTPAEMMQIEMMRRPPM